MKIPELLRGRVCDTDVPFRSEHSEVLFLLLVDQLWVCAIYCKKKLL